MAAGAIRRVALARENGNEDAHDGSDHGPRNHRVPAGRGDCGRAAYPNARQRRHPHRRERPPGRRLTAGLADRSRAIALNRRPGGRRPVHALRRPRRDHPVRRSHSRGERGNDRVEGFRRGGHLSGYLGRRGRRTGRVHKPQAHRASAERLGDRLGPAGSDDDRIRPGGELRAPRALGPECRRAANALYRSVVGNARRFDSRRSGSGLGRRKRGGRGLGYGRQSAWITGDTRRSGTQDSGRQHALYDNLRPYVESCSPGENSS